MRKYVALLVFAAVVNMTGAEMNRPQFSKENKFPDYLKPEVGLRIEYHEIQDTQEEYTLSDANLWSLNLFGRMGVYENLTLTANLPFNSLEPDEADTENGLGDIGIGLELRAFEDVFGYPYIIPHCTYTFDTGDENKGLGGGVTTFRLGVSIGTVVEDVVHFIGDVSYDILKAEENSVVLGFSTIYDLSEQFSLVVEGRMKERHDPNNQDDWAYYAGGGMVYKMNEKLTMGLYGNGATQADEDLFVTLKTSYDF